MSETNELLARELRALRGRVAALEAVELPAIASGTWTPAFLGTGTAGTFTYAGQSGVWARIGRRVVVHAYVQISAIGGAPTGNMRISGLPLTVASVGMDFSLAIGWADRINTSASVVQLTALALLGTTQIGLFEAFDNAAVAALPAANFTNASAGLELSGEYWTT